MTVTDGLEPVPPRYPTYFKIHLHEAAREAVIRPTSDQPRQSRATRPSGGTCSETPEELAARSVRRSRTALRRYCVANGVTRLGTLTYDGAVHDINRLNDDMRRFSRRLRSKISAPLPWVWVPEFHPGGHGLHVHLGLGRYVDWQLIERLWGQGRIDLRYLHRRTNGATGDVDPARILASYILKQTGAAHTAGQHRYHPARGFAPMVAPALCAATFAEAMAIVMDYVPKSSNPSVWSSQDDPGWTGPPVTVVRWTPPKG